jgi:hypothetical protein
MTFNQIVSQAKRLPPRQRLTLIEALTRSVRQDMRPHSASGEQLMHLAGAISSQDAQLMQEAINQECERVDTREW